MNCFFKLLIRTAFTNAQLKTIPNIAAIIIITLIHIFISRFQGSV